jgi:hypothetical protein
MNCRADDLSILKNESIIDTLLAHNQKKYDYRGEPGEEYRVIAGLFHEINETGRLQNRHIRWYSVINFLIAGFRKLRLKTDSAEISLLISDEVSREITGTTGHFKPFFIPAYIDSLESYITGISRLGIFLSSSQEKDKPFVSHCLGKISRDLNRLLIALDIPVKQNQGENAYRLSIKNASENILSRSDSYPEKLSRELKGLTKSALFMRLITRETDKMDLQTIRRLYRLDDFWNGLIP